MSTTGTLLRSLLVALILPAVVGCDSGEVELEEFVGSYQAEAFTTSAGGGTFDVRANGGDLSLTINADGTFTGDLVIPAGSSRGDDGLAPFNGAIGGVWRLEASTAMFDPDPRTGTFFDHAEWTVERDELRTTDFDLLVVLRKE